MTRFEIAGRGVGDGEPLFVIAEAGVHHENDLGVARELIDRAAEAGADAIKFQSYKAGRLASRFSPAYWDQSQEPAASQYELFAGLDHLDVDDYRALAEHAAEHSIVFLTTVFDEIFLDALADVLPAFKIASADLTHRPLMARIARQGKPVLLSTGASTVDEIAGAVRFLRDEGCEDLALLHCVLNYPCAPENANLRAVTTLAETFPDVVVGYSDHVPPEPGLPQLTAAWMLGARVVEKHFTLDKTLPGNDHYHAMDPDDLREFRERLALLDALLGDGKLGYLPSEEKARRCARRSLVAARDLPAGRPIGAAMIAVKRPGEGIEPSRLDEVVGRVPKADIEADTILQWSMFRGE